MTKYLVLFLALVFTAQAQENTALRIIPRFDATLSVQKTAPTNNTPSLKNSQTDTTEWVSFLSKTPGDTLLEAYMYTSDADTVQASFKYQFGIGGKILSTTALDSLVYHNIATNTAPAKGHSLWHRRALGATQIRAIVSTVTAQGGYLGTPSKKYSIGIVTRTAIPKK